MVSNHSRSITNLLSALIVDSNARGSNRPGIANTGKELPTVHYLMTKKEVLQNKTKQRFIS